MPRDEEVGEPESTPARRPRTATMAAPLEVPVFRFPALLAQPSSAALPEATAPLAALEWRHFKRRLEGRRLVPIRAAVAGHATERRAARELPPLASSRFRGAISARTATEVPPPDHIKRRLQRQQDALSRAISYNFTAPEERLAPPLKPPPRPLFAPAPDKRVWHHPQSPAHADDAELILSPDEAYTLACRGVARARGAARKQDRDFVAQLLQRGLRANVPP